MNNRDRREATFIEHLEELRQRLIRCVLYVGVAAVACWFVQEDLMKICQAPIRTAAEMAGVEIDFKIFDVAGGLIVAMQIAGVAGLILASPGWLLEAWMFIEPALEDQERKWIVPLLPAAVGLFLGGVAFCYWLSPRAFEVLIGFHSQLGIDNPEFLLKNYLTFLLRLLLIFGVMFELPLVIMFLSAVGIVKSEWLAKHWRIAIVIIAVVCAVVTPTPDAVTLSFLAGPMSGLYILSIFLARMVEKGKEKKRLERDAPASDPEDMSPTVETVQKTEHAPPVEPYYEYQGTDETQTEVIDDPDGEATDDDRVADDVEQFGDPYSAPDTDGGDEPSD